MRTPEAARVLVVVASIAAATASATAPKPPAGKVQRSSTISGTFDSTWNAIIDLFGERDWKIDKVDKPSGLITTDWMNLGEADATAFADCGSAPLASANSQVRFNLVVREGPAGVIVTVNTTFRQIRSFSNNVAQVDCYSKGAVERLIQSEVARRAKMIAKPDPNERKVVAGSSPLFCVVTAPDVGECWTSETTCTSHANGATCEQKAAGSCFNATKQLDGTKLTVCAVSIKDCETRRAVMAADPDYKVTGCGIYRVQ